ncbi:hypothetical protein J6590_030043 [Homalodisca vitripennis]|nr:hypothetical protein J6590_030043 [Homalodisca vitripennis]
MLTNGLWWRRDSSSPLVAAIPDVQTLSGKCKDNHQEDVHPVQLYKEPAAALHLTFDKDVCPVLGWPLANIHLACLWRGKTAPASPSRRR